MRWRFGIGDGRDGGLRRGLQRVRGGLGGVENGAGNYAESKCGYHGHCDGGTNRNPYFWSRRSCFGWIRFLGCDCGEAQVIGCGESRVEQADDCEPDCSAADGCREGIELAEEAAGEGNSDERDEEEDEQAAEKRRSIYEAAVVVDEGEMFFVSGDEGDDGEDADVHGGVGGDVKGCGGDAGFAEPVLISEAGEGSEQIAGVRDGG